MDKVLLKNKKTNVKSDRAIRFQSMLDEADLELSKLFRKSRKVHLWNRDGEILLVDDIPEQKGVLEVMLQALSVDISVVNVSSAIEAEDYLKDNNHNVKMIVVDIVLPGGISGLDFLEWLVDFNSEIPYVVVTGSEDIVDTVKEKFPGVDVLIKGRTGISEFADAMGLPELESSCGYDKIPVDSQFTI